MTTATTGLLLRFKPMTTVTTAGRLRARIQICYGYGMTTAARSTSRSTSRSMTT